MSRGGGMRGAVPPPVMARPAPPNRERDDDAGAWPVWGYGWGEEAKKRKRRRHHENFGRKPRARRGGK